MKIFSAAQIRECDKATLKNEGIESYSLMERAANACVEWILKNLKGKTRFFIFCGNGNNGGDGLAMARMLYLKGFDVNVYRDQQQEKVSNDAMLNLSYLQELSGIDIDDFEEVENIQYSKDCVIIDALLGTGLNRNLEGRLQKLVSYLNTVPGIKLAIDIPTGLSSDVLLNEEGTVFNADFTLSFQFWKKTFLHPETGKYCGKVEIIDINLDKTFIENTSTDDFIISNFYIKEIEHPRKNFVHKGNFGKTCLIAGSYGKIGAAVLSVQAALRTGSGLTFINAPQCGYEILQTTCPEAMFVCGGENHLISFAQDREDYTYGIGPGLGENPETEIAFFRFLDSKKQPLVIDADALNLLSRNPKKLQTLPKNSILTPHPKEFERLFGKTKNSLSRLHLAKEKAKEFGLVIVLKDHHTQIITPGGKVFYNITGNSGMAKGGSGDVLLGIITSLLSQNYPPEEAALFGVWLHGKAADLAIEDIAKESLVATDLIRYISKVFQVLNSED